MTKVEHRICDFCDNPIEGRDAYLEVWAHPPGTKIKDMKSWDVCRNCLPMPVKAPGLLDILKKLLGI